MKRQSCYIRFYALLAARLDQGLFDSEASFDLRSYSKGRVGKPGNWQEATLMPGNAVKVSAASMNLLALKHSHGKGLGATN